MLLPCYSVIVKYRKDGEKTLHLFKYSNANLTLITLFYFPEPQSTKTLRSCLNYVSQDNYKKKKLKSRMEISLLCDQVTYVFVQRIMWRDAMYKDFPIRMYTCEINTREIFREMSLYIHLSFNPNDIYLCIVYVYISIYIYI